MTEQATNQAVNEQNVPANLGGQKPVAAPAPAYNPMLSELSNPPAPAEAVKLPAAAPAVTDAPPVITIPTATAAAPSVSIGNLVEQFNNDPQVGLATSYLEAIATDGKLDVNRALAKAIADGDVTRIDEAYIREVLKDKAGNFLQTAQSVVKYVEHQRNALINEVHTSAGGEDAWLTALQSWQDSATPEEKATIRKLFDSGDRDSVKYAAQQVLQAARNAGVVIQHNNPLLGKNSGSSVGLSAEGYKQALAKAGRNIRPETYNELRELRELGKRQNI